MGPPHSPIFGTYGGHFCGRSETRFNRIGGPKLCQKHKLRPKSGANFWAPLWTPFAYRVMLFQNTLIINPACQVETWEAHMTRPFFQPKSSPISRPMKPRRSQSHIPNCASCCPKSSAADTQWKILDMCVRGCSIASMCFNYTDERRLALGTIWCKVNLYFVRSRLILYRMLCIWHLHVHGDQITMHISMYILCCSGKIVYILLRCQSMCIFGRVRWMHLSGVSYSLFDPMVWESLLERIEFGRVLSERSWFSILEISELMYSTPTCPWWLDHHVPANTWCCFYVGTHAIPLGGTAAGGTAKRGDYHDSMSHTAINLTVLSCAKVRNYYRRDRSGTAAGPQNVGIPTIPGCRRDRSRRRRDHFTCKFIGAGPHTPFGNYNNIPGGVRWCFGGCEDFSEDVLST